MLFSPRISTRELAGLCRRLSTSLEAGIDMRSVWTREADRTLGPAARPRFEHVREAVRRGDSLADALSGTDDYFPSLFRELAEVGQETGHEGEVFGRLAQHYDEQLKLRRLFLGMIAWPMLQLLIAVGVVGFLIWILGFIGNMTGTTIDVLGFGLVGTRGLLVYLAFVGSVTAGLALLVQAIRRGVMWTRPLQEAVFRLPGIGPAVEALCLARLAWSLHLTLESGMEIRRAVALSLRSTSNARYLEHVEPIRESITAGNPLYEGFVHTGDYPNDFLDALHVGEQSGRLVESMEHLSLQYRQKAGGALKLLTMVAAFAVWGLVALLIIIMIFRIFSFYVNTIYDAMP